MQTEETLLYMEFEIHLHLENDKWHTHTDLRCTQKRVCAKIKMIV